MQRVLLAWADTARRGGPLRSARWLLGGAWLAMALLCHGLGWWHVQSPLLWLPTGVAVGGLVLAGLRAWPGLLLGSLCFAAWTVGRTAPGGPGPWVMIGALTLAFTLQGLVGAALLLRWLPAVRPVDQPIGRAVQYFSVLGALVAACLVAVWPVTWACWQSGQVTAADGVWRLVWQWLVGGTLGGMALVPWLLVIRTARREGSGWRRPAVVGAVALGTSLVAVLVLHDARHWEQARMQSLFEHHVEEVAREMQRELAVNEAALRGLASCLEQDQPVQPRHFHAVASDLKFSARTLQALAWSPVVAAPDRVPSARARREAGDATPQGNGGSLPAAARTRQVVVREIEPAVMNAAAVGLNLTMDAAAERAIGLAERSGQMAASARVKWVGDDASPWRMLLVMPVDAHHGQDGQHSGTAVGHAVAVVRAADLLRSAWVAVEAGGHGLDGVRVRFIDASAPVAEQAIAAVGDPTVTGAEPLAWQSPLRLSVNLPHGQRDFRLVAESTPWLWVAHGSNAVLLSEVSMLLLLTLCTALATVVTGRQQTLDSLLALRTDSLRRAEAEAAGQRNQLQAVLAASPDGFAAADAQGQIVAVNAAFESLTGLRPQDWAMLDMAGLLRRLAGEGRAVDSLPAGMTQCVGRDGRARQLQVVVRPMAGSPPTQVLFLHDLTVQVALDQAKTQFIAHAAHEIRTPLTSILAYANLMHRKPDMAATMRDEMVRQVLDKATELNALQRSMLDLAELESQGRASMRWVVLNLQETVQAAVAQFTPPAGRDAPLLQGPETPLHAQGSATKLSLLLRHLLANAYAFSEAPSQVRVQLDAASIGPGRQAARLRVCDEGCGMSAEQAERAFERFYRADTSGSQPGFGLGLCIVKLVAELHHGTVTIDSAPGQGTRVTVLLPLDAAPPA